MSPSHQLSAEEGDDHSFQLRGALRSTSELFTKTKRHTNEKKENASLGRYSRPSDGTCCNDHAQTSDVASSSVQGWQQGSHTQEPWEEVNSPAEDGHEDNGWDKSFSTQQQQSADELDDWEEEVEMDTYLAGESGRIHRDLLDSDTLDSQRKSVVLIRACTMGTRRLATRRTK